MAFALPAPSSIRDRLQLTTGLTTLGISLFSISSTALLSLPSTAWAEELRFGETTVRIDTTITSGVQIRTAKRDPRFLPEVNGGPTDRRALVNPATGMPSGTQAMPGAAALTAGAVFVPAQERSSVINNAIQGFDGDINRDDGRLNFDRGDFTSAVIGVTHDVQFDWRNVALFGRFNYFYDGALDSRDNYARSYIDDSARRDVARDIELYDLYADVSFDTPVPLNFRIGNQVINWGEGVFLPNGINSVNPIDLPALRRGSELREALLPIWSISASAQVTPNVSVEGFYLLEWDEIDPEPAGTPFSLVDTVNVGSLRGGNINGDVLIGDGFFAGRGFRRNCASVLPSADPTMPIPSPFAFNVPANPTTGAPALNPVALADCQSGRELSFATPLPTGQGEEARFSRNDPDRISNRGRNNASHHGQFGFATHWFAESLNATEFSFFFMNYHSRLPLYNVITGTPTVGIQATAPNTATSQRVLRNAGCSNFIRNGFFGDPRLSTITDPRNVAGTAFAGQRQQLGSLAESTITQAQDPRGLLTGANSASLDVYAQSILFRTAAALRAQDPRVMTPNPFFNPLPLMPMANPQGINLIGSAPSVLKIIQLNCAFSVAQSTPVNLAPGAPTPVILPLERTGAETLLWNPNAGFRFDYPEDIRMIGSSFNTAIGNWGLQGEFSYRFNQPFQLDAEELTIGSFIASCSFLEFGGDLGPLFERLSSTGINCIPNQLGGGRFLKGYTREDVLTTQLGATRIFPPSNPLLQFLGADSAVLTGEIGLTWVPDAGTAFSPQASAFGLSPATLGSINPNDPNALATIAALLPALPSSIPWANICRSGSGIPLGSTLDLDLRSDAACRPDEVSLGYAINASLTYNNVMNAPLSITPKISWRHDITGNTPLPLGTYREGRKAAILGVDAIWRDAFKASMSYTNYFGGSDYNEQTDQDYFFLSLSYSF